MKKIIVAGAAALILTACSTNSNDQSHYQPNYMRAATMHQANKANVRQPRNACAVSRDSRRTRVEAMSLGCASGMLISSLLFGGPSLASCLNGRSVGSVVGNDIAQRKCAYASKEAELIGEMRHTREVNQTLRRTLDKQERQLQQAERSVAALIARQRAGHNSRAKLSRALQDVQNQMQRNQSTLSVLQAEMNYKASLLTRASPVPQSRHDAGALQREVALLQQNIQRLQLSNQQLSRLQQRLRHEGV